MNGRLDPNRDLLHAFVDEQLDGASRARLFQALQEDEALRQQVCQLQETKAWVRSAFADVQAPERKPPRRQRRLPWGLAASVAALALAFAGGWLVRGAQPGDGLNAVVLDKVRASHYRVVLHITERDPHKFDRVLDEAQRLLERYRAQHIQVDVLANAGGIDLLREGPSPYARRVRALMQRYPGSVHFVACMNTLHRLQTQGQPVRLIPHTRQDTTAVDFVVRRLRAGWSYIRI